MRLLIRPAAGLACVPRPRVVQGPLRLSGAGRGALAWRRRCGQRRRRCARRAPGGEGGEAREAAAGPQRAAPRRAVLEPGLQHLKE